MDTLASLLEINDSIFERLVAGFLRRRDTQLAGLIATGINEAGESIPCAVDNIVYVPGPSPRCVAVASTTTARKGLARKWLGGKNYKGDIDKAAEAFQKWKADKLDVPCVLYLATNLPLKQDIDLYRKAIKHGLEHAIEIQIVEASQLVDFLDHDADGQYIREKLLRIDVERLSADLLGEIARYSLTHHRQSFTFGRGSQEREITRDVYAHAIDLLDRSNASFIGLRGASGTGKSTLLRQLGHHISLQGGLALWVPAEELTADTALANILLRTLRRFHPSLNARAGDEAIRLASLLPNGLTLLVDDVNRLPTPHLALTAIQTLDALIRAETAAGSRRGRSWLRFIVPLWPAQITTDPNRASQEDSGWEFIELHTYSQRERVALAGTLADAVRHGMRPMIDALNGDPFLCGLVPPGTRLPSNASRSALIATIFDKVVRQAAVEASRTLTLRATPNEYIAALEKLIELMLHMAEPEPEWKHIREALDNRTVELLYVLSQTNQLSWIEQTANQETWRWKHDRLRDALVGRWLAQHALPKALNSELSDTTQAWLADPGLAEAWALALVFLPDTVAQTHALATLAEWQPLALAEALRLSLFPSEGNLRSLLVSGLRRVLTGFDERVREFVGSPQRSVLQKLSQTDDPLVLEVTQDVGSTWNVWAARLRNGDVSAGLEWISRELAHGDFLPSVHFPFLEEAVEAFAAFYDRERIYVANALAHAVAQPDLAAAALTFAGYLAWPELSMPLWTAWNALSDTEKRGTVTPVVWTLSRCGDATVQNHLEAALLYVRQLRDQPRSEEEQNQGTERYWQFTEPLHLAQRWSMTPESAATWAKVATNYPDLRETMCYLLRALDHPAAIETYVRWSAERGGTLWDEAVETNDPLARVEHGPRTPMSPAARDHLWEIIENDPDLTTRRIAFVFWKRVVSGKDLERLQKVSARDPLFDEVLKVRLKLRDRTAVNVLVARMQTDPGAWCGYAPLFYDDMNVHDTLLEQLEVALKDRLWRSNAIMQHLPADGVREIVRQKHDLLLQCPRTWPFLWRSEVPEALTFVENAVDQADADDLRFFFRRGGFPFSVSRQMLDSVLPGLDRFPPNERRRLAELAIRSGFKHWANDHLPDVVAATESKHFWLTPEQVRETLTAAATAVPEGVRAVYDNSDLFRLEHRIGPQSMSAAEVLEILQTWLAESRDSGRRTIAAMVIAAFGTSQDISWWHSIEPADEQAHNVWSNALYILLRRRWQKAEGRL